MTEREKADQFFDDHMKYKENNLEKIERQELYFVLEQFFESQRQNPINDPQTKGEKALADA